MYKEYFDIVDFCPFIYALIDQSLKLQNLQGWTDVNTVLLQFPKYLHITLKKKIIHVAVKIFQIVFVDDDNYTLKTHGHYSEENVDIYLA